MKLFTIALLTAGMHALTLNSQTNIESAALLSITDLQADLDATIAANAARDAAEAYVQKTTADKVVADAAVLANTDL